MSLLPATASRHHTSVVHVTSGANFDSDATEAAKRGATHLVASSLNLQIINHVDHLRNLVSINLSMNGLVMLPREFSLLGPRLQELYLNNNGFKEFPASILALTSLRCLNLSQNPLSLIPRGISQLEHLELLFLSQCSVASLPSSFGNLTRLQQLQLQGNAFVDLPSSVGQMDRLQQLHLSNCRLMSLPGDIGRMTSLKMLNLQCNDLTSLPNSMWRLKHLWSLDVSRNRLRNLPRLPNTLSHIGLLGNSLSDLPITLRSSDCKTICKFLFESLPMGVDVSSSSLRADLLCRFHDEEFSDLDFVVGEDHHIVPAHLALIRARIGRVDAKALFEGDAPVKMGERWVWHVKSSVSKEAFLCVLEFMYCGSLDGLERCDVSFDYVIGAIHPSRRIMDQHLITIRPEIVAEEEFRNDIASLMTEQRDLCDGIFLVGGEEFLFHRFIVAARCAPMAVMFSGAFREGVSKEPIVLEEETSASFRVVMDFIYMDDPSIDGEVVSDVLKAASKWQLIRLLNMCEKVIVEGLEPEILVPSLELADMFHCDQLKLAVMSRLKEQDSSLLLGQKEFQDLPMAVQSELLLSKRTSDKTVLTTRHTMVDDDVRPACKAPNAKDSSDAFVFDFMPETNSPSDVLSSSPSSVDEPVATFSTPPPPDFSFNGTFSTFPSTTTESSLQSVDAQWTSTTDVQLDNDAFQRPRQTKSKTRRSPLTRK